MTAKYLLPCACGRQLVVEPRQAGQIIPCACGESLQAPTLLDMASLEPAPMISVSAAAPDAWDWKSRLRLSGAVLVLAAIGGAIGLHYARPVSRFELIDPEQLREKAKSLSPLETWTYWEKMNEGLDRRVDQKYLEKLNMWHLMMGADAVLGLAGVALMAATLVRGLGSSALGPSKTQVQRPKT